MLKEKQLEGEVLKPCTGSFTQLFRLSFVHTIEKQNLANKLLIIDNVSKYWYYYKPCPI